MKKFLLPLAAITLLTAGCGGGGGPSCNFTSTGLGICEAFTGSGFTTSSVQAACTAANGTYSAGACAAGNDGTCTLLKGTAAEVKYTFTGTADAGSGFTGSAFCTASGGTYSATN